MSMRRIMESTAVEVNGSTLYLAAIIGTWGELSESEQAAWVKPASTSEVNVGDRAYVHSYGDLRLGVVTKVGRTRVTVSFTTKGSCNEAVRYNCDPKVTHKSSDLRYVRVFRPGREG